jgi:hypothetical protein
LATLKPTEKKQVCFGNKKFVWKRKKNLLLTDEPEKVDFFIHSFCVKFFPQTIFSRTHPLMIQSE